MTSVDLAPAAGEPELADTAYVGEWAEALAGLVTAPQQPPWCAYAARRDGRLVGFGCFKGASDAARQVEIAYLSFVAERGKGLARSIAAELIAIAGREGAAAVLAHTLREEGPSTGVLRANGFSQVGEVEDPEDGTVWRWKRTI